MAKIVEEFIVRGENDTMTFYYKTDKNNYYYYTRWIDRRGMERFTSKTKINENCYNLFKPCGEMIAV